VQALLPELYRQGLTTGDFEPAVRALLGEAAPLSPASIVRLKAQGQAEYEAWRQRPLESRYAYCWADGLYLKAGPGDEQTAVLIIIGVTADGRKELLAMVEGYRESRESWRDVLRDLRRRGLKTVCLFIGDGGLGLWAAVAEVYPAARRQLEGVPESVEIWRNNAQRILTPPPPWSPVCVLSGEPRGVAARPDSHARGAAAARHPATPPPATGASGCWCATDPLSPSASRPR
jgi:transposase-like protein